MDIEKLALLQGAENVGTVNVCDIVFYEEFRKACESNACGMFNRCWMCPPHVGEIGELIARAKTYKTAIVYQTIHEIEDSYDIEGMLESGEKHNKMAHRINDVLCTEINRGDFLHLGAGGCKMCTTCAKREEKPCRFPERAMASLESYGIAVSDLAKHSGMKYINGENTVTYFGAVLLK